MKDLSSILFLLSLLTLFVSAVPTPDSDAGSGNKYFGVRIKTEDKLINKRRYHMDIKDSIVGFGRPDAEKFEAYINGTKQGNSYLITHRNGFGFLLEDKQPRYDFMIDFVIPPTDFKAYWAVIDGHLTCHQLTNGFKYFPDPTGGYIILWDTRDEMGKPLFMEVEWCGRSVE